MSMNSNLKVGVSIFYKPTDELKKRLGKYKFLLPVNAGSGLKTDDWVAKNCEFDDSGENISKLNPWFNELTVLYWMWNLLYCWIRVFPGNVMGFAVVMSFSIHLSAVSNGNILL